MQMRQKTEARMFTLPSSVSELFGISTAVQQPLAAIRSHDQIMAGEPRCGPMSQSYGLGYALPSIESLPGHLQLRWRSPDIKPGASVLRGSTATA